jgi:hypothetical protein
MSQQNRIFFAYLPAIMLTPVRFIITWLIRPYNIKQYQQNAQGGQFTRKKIFAFA